MSTAERSISARSAGSVGVGARRRVRCVLVAVWVVGVGQLTPFLTSSFAIGQDFLPLRHAATALRSGRSVYSDPAFVYLPTTPIALSFTALGSTATAAWSWDVLLVAGLGLTAWLIAGTAEPRWRLVVLTLAAYLLVLGGAADDSLFVANASLLMVPFAVATTIAMGRGRWTLGCALLCASVLLKPLLVPLALVPLVFGRGRALLVTAAPTAAVLALAVAFVPGGRQLPHVVRSDLNGTNLHGPNAIENLAVDGWLSAHHVPPAPAAAVRGLTILAVVAVVVVALVRLRRRRAGPDVSAVAQASTLVVAAVFVAGSMSEAGYLDVVLALLLLQAVTARSARAVAGLLPGIVLLGLPADYRDRVLGGHAPQTWYLLAEVAALLGTVAGVAGAGGATPAGHRACHALPATSGRISANVE